MSRFFPFFRGAPRVAVIRLSGAIGGAGRFGAGMSDEALAPLIERAFRAGKPRAVALIVNSPGGSPVQSALIAARIRRLAEERRVPVHAFVEDVAASGGYWLACAADHIWVDANSVVGSVGVIAASFGFHDLLARHGIERRVYTAGKSKSMNDPFQPEKPEDVARLKALMGPIHENFIAHVKARRGERLSQEVALFEGDIWVGAQAVGLGLADGIAHPVPKLKEIYGDKVRLVPHKARRPLLSRLRPGIAAAEAAGAIVDAAEERALWARYGL